MSISLHGNGTVATGSAVNSLSVTVPAVTNNDFMVLIGVVSASHNLNNPAGWGTPQITKVAGTQTTYVWTRTAASEPASYSLTTQGAVNADILGQIRTYTSTLSSMILDTIAGNSNVSGTSDPAPSITLANTNEMVVGIYSAQSGEASITLPGTLANSAEAGPNSIGLGTGDGIFASAGATGTQTATWPTAALNVGILLAIKEPGDLSNFFWMEGSQYPYASFRFASIRRLEPLFADPTGRAVLGLPNVIQTDLNANYWFSEWQPVPKFRDPFWYRRVVQEQDDLQPQMFTQPSAPVGGWNLHEDYRPFGPLRQMALLGWPEREPFIVFQIPLQTPLDTSEYVTPQFQSRLVSRRAYSDPAVIFITLPTPIQLGEFGMGNVTPQVPMPPRRMPREDQPRSMTIDIGDLLPSKAWPADMQSTWIRPTPSILPVRNLSQPFDTSVFQPVQLPPMIPWDGGAAALPRALATRRFYADHAGNIFPGIQPNTDQLGPWQALWPGPVRSFRFLPVQAPAVSESLLTYAIDVSVLSAWNASAALPRWMRPLLAGDQSPMPKLPDANEGILGAWHLPQPQIPTRPIRGSAYLAAAADPLRTWGLVAESLAWYAPWPELAVHRPLIQARRQTVEAVGPGNFLTSGEAPYFWLWDSGQQVPVRYPASPARTHTTEAMAGALLSLPAGLIVVAGPYFVFQGQIYVAGAVQGDLSSE